LNLNPKFNPSAFYKNHIPHLATQNVYAGSYLDSFLISSKPSSIVEPVAIRIVIKPK
jgi:hypothetical protein